MQALSWVEIGDIIIKYGIPGARRIFATVVAVISDADVRKQAAALRAAGLTTEQEVADVRQLIADVVADYEKANPTPPAG